MKATDKKGVLQQIPGCKISIPGFGDLIPRVLPDITDSKSAAYADEIVIGRSFPIKTYSHSDNRIIGIRWKFVILDDKTLNEAKNGLMAIQSCVYPYDTPSNSNAPYAPPAICKLSCKRLFASGSQEEMCAVLKRYSVSYPTDVAWDESTYLPYKFDVDMEWEIVFASEELPGREKIIK